MKLGGLVYVGLLAAAVAGWGQTQIDLRSQSRDVDFSAAVSTKPVKTGTVLPATCGVGEIFFKSNAPAGSNLFLCASSNQWSAMAAANAINTSTIGSLPSTCSIGDLRFVTDATVSSGGFFVFYCTAANSWTQFGYVAGGTGALASDCSSSLCTIDVTAAVPLKTGANVWSGANDFSTAVKTAPFRIGSTDPATCDASSREFFFNSTSNTLKSCYSTNVWTASAGPAFSGGNGYLAPYGLQLNGASAVNWNPDGTGAFVCTQFVVPYSLAVTKAGVIVGVAPGAGKALVVGYMNSALTMLAQGTVVAPAGSDNAIVTLGTTLSLNPGVYYQCIGGEDLATTLFPGMLGTASGGFAKTLDSGSDKRVISCSNTPTGTGSSYALPSSCGTATAKNNAPGIASVLIP